MPSLIPTDLYVPVSYLRGRSSRLLAVWIRQPARPTESLRTWRHLPLLPRTYVTQVPTAAAAYVSRCGVVCSRVPAVTYPGGGGGDGAEAGTYRIYSSAPVAASQSQSTLELGIPGATVHIIPCIQKIRE